MPSTGNVFPQTGENHTGIGATAWSSPGNIVSDNTTDASCNAAASSQYLVARSFNFNIPAGATINGITVRIEASESSTGSETLSARLQDDAGSLTGSTKTASLNGTGKTVYTYGAANDAWGATLTPAVVNNANFGVRFWFTTAHNIAVDFVTVAVEYTLPTFTGSGAPSFGKATATGAATFSVPTRSASGSPSFGAATGSGAGAITNPSYTGSGSPRFGAATGGGTATHASPTYTGTLGKSFGAVTGAGEATFAAGAGGSSGSGAPAFGAATGGGAATFSPPAYTGSLTATFRPATGAGSATFLAREEGTGRRHIRTWLRLPGGRAAILTERREEAG